MSAPKIYAGAKLRELRTRIGLTQKDYAAKLGVSLPYLNQMENNHRPLSAQVVLALASEFGADLAEFSAADGTRMVSDMREALADPIFNDAVPVADLRLAASNAPALAHAFLTLHRAYLDQTERLASLDQAIAGGDGRIGLTPWEEVRDFFHYCDNYLDALDRAAERQAAKGGLAAQLEAAGVTVRISDAKRLRAYDARTRVLTLSDQVSAATRTFQTWHQLALVTQSDLLDATLDLARFSSDEARGIGRIGLANYFAGAAQMPYAAFLAAAQETRHDLERLAHRFGASIEQVGHRLSTMQRPGAKGVPFFFVRVDQAGTITKRHSATQLQFARYGGACPLWNVHRAFETPGRFLRQLAETPDGARYFCLARDVSKPGGAFHAPTRRYAIGLGCSVEHATALVYADGMALKEESAFEPIGISCRICTRRGCHQRSVPPLEKALAISHDERGVLPYRIAD
ncbi:MAG: short-chain fatty acyl-CoA regulator family protein [Pseudomonadota bacterium]